MSEQKYYVFQKSVDGKEIVSQLVRFKFMGENAKFMPVSKSKSCRYENSFSEFTKMELAKIGNGALYKEMKDVVEYRTDTLIESNTGWTFTDEIIGDIEWINPIIKLVPVEDDE